MASAVVQRYIEEHQLVSIMNNTKWRELVAAITSEGSFDPPVKIRYIFDADNVGGFSPVWWEEVEADGFEQIEWLMISPVKEVPVGALVGSKQTDYTDFIRSGLDKHSIPYTLTAGIFLVKGYIRPKL
jgi:hypothetical protein